MRLMRKWLEKLERNGHLWKWERNISFALMIEIYFTSETRLLRTGAIEWGGFRTTLEVQWIRICLPQWREQTKARVPQLLSWCSRACKLQLLRPWVETTEAHVPRACAPQQKTPSHGNRDSAQKKKKKKKILPCTARGKNKWVRWVQMMDILGTILKRCVMGPNPTLSGHKKSQTHQQALWYCFLRS